MLMPWTLAELGVTQWWMLLSCEQTHRRAAKRGGGGGEHLYLQQGLQANGHQTFFMWKSSQGSVCGDVALSLQCCKPASYATTTLFPTSKTLSTHYSWAATVLPGPQPSVLCVYSPSCCRRGC